MFTEELDEFFNTDDFAVTATYDGSAEISVILDHEFLQAVGVMGGRQTGALVKASDVAANPKGKSLLIDGTTYTIESIRPIDDGAVAVLELSKAA